LITNTTFLFLLPLTLCELYYFLKAVVAADTAVCGLKSNCARALLYPESNMAESTSNGVWNDVEANKLPEKVEELKINGELPTGTGRKRVVVVGLGMVGIAFM
jgi:hypothetical protein